MGSKFTLEERAEIEVWLDIAKKMIIKARRDGQTVHYLTAGARLFWLLTMKGQQTKPELLLDLESPPYPVFPMAAHASAFPTTPTCVARALNGIAVVTVARKSK